MPKRELPPLVFSILVAAIAGGHTSPVLPHANAPAALALMAGAGSAGKTETVTGSVVPASGLWRMGRREYY